ncbi:hypothetical protein [Nocardia sp. Marseille-Q1738]
MSHSAVRLPGMVLCPNCGDHVPLVEGRLGIHVNAEATDACQGSNVAAEEVSA